MWMSQDDRTAEKLTPEERRTHLRAFADRMLLKVSAMDDPEDIPGVEKAVRIVAVIERIYYRCDRSERHTPDPRKLEAERATNQSAAIKARVSLANMLEWGEQRRKDLGKWWDAAETASVTPVTVAAPQPMPHTLPQKPAETIECKPAQTSPQGDALRQSVLAMLDAAFDTLSDSPSQDAPEILAATDCMVKAQAAWAQNDISEDDFNTIEDAVNDWLKKRPPPS